VIRLRRESRIDSLLRVMVCDRQSVVWFFLLSFLAGCTGNEHGWGGGGKTHGANGAHKYVGRKPTSRPVAADVAGPAEKERVEDSARSQTGQTSRPAVGADRAGVSLDERSANSLELPESPADLRKVQVIPSTVIVLNDESITVEDIVEPILPFLKEMAAQKTLGEFDLLKFKTIREEIQDQQDYILVYQEFGKRVTEEEEKHLTKLADKEIKDRINKEFGGRQARYEKYLEELGLSMKKIQEKRKRQLIVIKALQDKFRPLVRPPRRNELKEYYERNKAEFSSPAKVEFYVIEAAFEDYLKVPTDQASAAAKAEARAAALKTIRQAKDEIDSGMSFEAVARQYAKGLLQHSGGLWGTISAPVPVPRWTKASEVVLGLKPGQVSDIIEGPDGFCLVRCGKRNEGRSLSFEEAQPELVKHFESSQYGQMILHKKMELRRKAEVRGDARGLFMKVLARLDTLLPSQTPPGG
jgi:hypothetical protein